MKAVVMAGGEGTRLRPLTCTRPKPMIELLGKPVIGYILELLVQNGFDEIAVTVRYRAEDIENYVESLNFKNVTLRCVEETRVLGTAGSVKNAAKDWNEPFLVISGDCMCDIELSKVMLYHKSIHADATIVCLPVDDPGEYGTLNLTKSGVVDSFCEKPDWSHASSDLANTGIYVLEPSLLMMIPDNIQYDFAAHLFPEMMQEGKRLFGYQTTAYWCDIGDLKSLRACCRDLMAHKINLNLPQSKNGVFSEAGHPDGCYDIVPPVYFGKNVTVGMNSVIGPFTVLEDNVTVAENTRLKKTTVMKNTAVGGNCDAIGAIVGERCVLKSNSVALEGSCIGDGCVVESGSTVSNNILIWPEKHVPYRSVLTDNLRDGRNEYELISADGICGTTFAEMSCERCCRLGEALASSSCGGKVGIGYDSSRSSKALAMAVLAGLISGGSKISDFGECFESQMGFFVSFCALDSGIYISATPEKTEIRLFGEYGLPLYRKYERELESRYKRSDFRRCCGSECNEIHDMSAVSEIYEGQLLAFAGDALSGSHAKVVTANPLIRETTDKCFYLLGCSEKELPEFAVNYSGRKTSCKDENGTMISHERLLVLCGLDAFEKGKDICVPFDAPFCLDDLAKRYDRTVYRVGRSPMADFDGVIGVTARKSMWAYDGLSLVFTVMGIMAQKEKTLAELMEKVPSFGVAARVIGTEISPAKIASILGIRSGANTQGLRKTVEKGSVIVTGAGGGRLLRILAEADTMEAAKEICIETEQKIREDTLDIYHQGE